MIGSSCMQCNAAQTVKASGTYETPWADLCQTHKRYAQFYNANIETVKTTRSALKDALHGFIKHFLKPGLVGFHGSRALTGSLLTSALGFHCFVQDFDKPGLQVRVLATGASVPVVAPLFC